MKKTIVFQGDSITDMGRLSDSAGIGHGYVKYVIENLALKYKDLVFYNRGISGNRVKDLQARWQKDAIDLYPNIITIMIGINDVWRRFDSNDITTDKDFELSYRNILTALKQNNSKIIMISPFVLKCGVYTKDWDEELNGKIKACYKLAAEFADTYIALNDIFSKLSENESPASFAADGVHLTDKGAKVLADLLAQEIEKFL